MGHPAEYAWVTTSRPDGEERRLLVHALTTPAHHEALVAATARAADAIRTLSGLLGPYAWSEHWLVDGPEGGMEYPGLTMSHGDDRTLHEVVHQWFPMMVGSDETRFDCLDEGLASFLPAAVQERPLGRLDDGRATATPILLPNDLRSVRAVLGYGRGRRMLEALAAEHGEEALLRALRIYATEWRFKHPSPWDFMATVERSLGVELDGFWLAWLFSRDAVRR